MEKSIIFGPDLKLPSIDGVKSGCENELYLLMKEIDLAFERKHKDILNEASELKLLCQAKNDEIENLKSVVSFRSQNSRKNVEDHTKYLITELAKLKEENARLMKENTDLQNKVQKGQETENRLQSIMKSLKIQQEENVMLKDRLTKLSKQHDALQGNYQQLLNVMTLEQKIGSSEQRMNMNVNTADFVDALISEETEKYLNEESKHCEVLQSKINEEIEALKRTLRDETV
ncbi:calcium-binding and coiled-coil domain-containing protein 2-like isoform X1 [Argiope bruennichi]|uniref:calcium-binding and coiled-coil domain-containing protein 2-like isoform X1 n=2 Tax=Argiope bruennichi TaxID=94029 RepID=UPI0024949689|nr:calcium-binding and coiled-coil domain-containing protein 2-like isoform X1 [Argiope bruennichi]